MNSSDHLSEHDLDQYLRRALPPGELLASDDHLARCDSCHARLQEKQEAQGAIVAVTAAFDEALTTTEHPTYEQLASYVDDELGGADRKLLEKHLQACPECETEARDLLLQRAELAPKAAPEPVHVPHLRWKVSHLWQAPTFRATARAAAIAAAAALVVWLATLPMRKQATDRARAPGHPAPPSLQAPSPQEVLVSLNDGGGLLLLDNKGQLQGLPPSEHAYEEAVKAVLLAQRLPRPALLRELAGESTALMGAQEDRGGFRLLNPVGVAVLEDHPVLRWHPLNGATRYDVMVYSEDLHQVASGRSLSATRWQPARPLPRGHTYAWQVRALVEDKEFVAPSPAAPQAKFRVIDQAKADQLTRLRQTHATSHLLLGVLYAQAGVLEEAERELELVVEANPQSPLAAKLLASVKASRR